MVSFARNHLFGLQLLNQRAKFVRINGLKNMRKIFTFFIGLAMAVMLNAQTNNSGFRAVVEELPRPIYDQRPEFVELYYKAWVMSALIPWLDFLRLSIWMKPICQAVSGSGIPA